METLEDPGRRRSGPRTGRLAAPARITSNDGRAAAETVELIVRVYESEQHASTTVSISFDDIVLQGGHVIAGAGAGRRRARLSTAFELTFEPRGGAAARWRSRGRRETDVRDSRYRASERSRASRPPRLRARRRSVSRHGLRMRIDLRRDFDQLVVFDELDRAFEREFVGRRAA